MISTVTSRILLYLRKHSEGGKKANFVQYLNNYKPSMHLKYCMSSYFSDFRWQQDYFLVLLHIPRYIQSLKHEKKQTMCVQ